MTILSTFGGASSGVDTGDIGHSLRCRSAASAYLNLTLSTNTGNPFTASLLIKRGSLATRQFFLSATNGTNNSGIGFDASDRLIVVNNSGADNASTAVFRDPTSWLHVVLNSNGTTVNAYVNNVLVLTFSASLVFFNTNVAHNIGRLGVSSLYFDGYISRIAFVSGSALTPSSFGYFNTEINEWVSKSQSAVKAVVDAGGTNSTMLDFDDATSLTTLGYDKSSKGNNWTLNNFSLTAGTTYDHMLDVPGNSYATWNPLIRTFNNSGSINQSDGNLLTTLGAYANTAPATIGVFSGKWYWEVTPASTSSTASFYIGIVREGYNTAAQPSADTNQWSYYGQTGTKQNNSNVAYGATYGVNDVIGVALDVGAGSIEFFKNNVSQGVAFTNVSGTVFPMCSFGNTGTSTFVGNFGQRPFAYTPPTGFKALCQANLPDVAIKNPKLHFDIKTRTGTAATYSVTGIGFPPDLVWVKSRGRALDHALYDSVRGVQKQLESNSTGAETTETAGLAAFNSDGYTGGALDQINGTTATNSFVDWLWKAGGAAVSNTAGSITSQVSANVDAGFSIVTYTGTGANATVGHGLTKVPKLVIVKQRTAGTVENWAVSHTSIANTEYLLLNTTAAKTAGATYWNSTTPTTSVFSVGSAADTNESAKDFVAYCFADIEGYSKAFSYTGNGSADGPYVHLGFKPRWLLIKRSDSAADWILIDTARDPYNHEGMSILYPHAASAEYLGGAQDVDLLSNGFKPRDTHTAINASSGTYIGFAIADVAGKYSLGR